MPTIRTEQPGVDVCRYLKHWANPSFVEQELVRHHGSMARDLRLSKSRDVAVCVGQGLEYLTTSDAASVLTRPLPLFYAAENFAKGTCVFLDPTLHADDFKSHGLKHDSSKRHSIRNLRATVSPPSRDVWSSYSRLANTQRAVYNVLLDRQSLSFETEVHFKPPPPPGATLTVGHLALQLPEIIDDILLAGWGTPRVVHVSTYSIVEQTGPPHTRAEKLTLRHRRHEATRELVLSRLRSGPLSLYEVVRDEFDIVEIKKRDDEVLGTPAFVMDVFREPYLDLTQTRRETAEPLAYFAILFVLSSSVRYEPKQWQRLLEIRPAEAILVERLLDLARRKLPNLVLNTLHSSHFHFSTAGN